MIIGTLFSASQLTVKASYYEYYYGWIIALLVDVGVLALLGMMACFNRAILCKSQDQLKYYAGVFVVIFIVCSSVLLHGRINGDILS